MKLFTKHPHSVGETYLQHMRVAMTYGGKMVLGGLACMMHGIFPFLFVNTGSQTALKLCERFLSRNAAGQSSISAPETDKTTG